MDRLHHELSHHRLPHRLRKILNNLRHPRVPARLHIRGRSAPPGATNPLGYFPVGGVPEALGGQNIEQFSGGSWFLQGDLERLPFPYEFAVAGVWPGETRLVGALWAIRGRGFHAPRIPLLACSSTFQPGRLWLAGGPSDSGFDVAHIIPAEPPGQLPGVRLLQCGVFDAGDRGRNGLHGLQPPFRCVKVKRGERRSYDKLHHWNPGHHQITHCGVAAGQAQVARVLTIRCDRDEAFAQELLVSFEGTHGCFLPGFIAVEGINHLAAEVGVIQHEAPHHLQVVRPERCSTRGNRRRHACGVHGHHIRVALNNDCLVALGNILLRLVNSEQHLRLLVQQGLRGVHVLPQLVVVEEFAGTEANDIVRGVADRPGQTSMKPVNRPTTTLGSHPGGLQLFDIKPLAEQELCQRVPSARRVATPKLLRVFLRKTTVE